MAKKKPEPNLDHIAPDLRSLATPIVDLREDPTNARLHSAVNLHAIAASLRRYGQRKPIVVHADGTCVAGSGTLAAARDILGWTHLAVTRFQEGAELEAAAYAIADNRTAELADWDYEQLSKTLQGLDDELRASTGFAPEQLDVLLRHEPMIDPDDSPATAAGRHILRILVKDGVDADELKAIVAGALEANGLKDGWEWV